MISRRAAPRTSAQGDAARHDPDAAVGRNSGTPSPGASRGASSPGPSLSPSIGGLHAPPCSSGLSPTPVSGDLSPNLCASLNVGGSEGLSFSTGPSTRLDRSEASSQSRPLSAEVSLEARHQGRHSLVSPIPEVSVAPSGEDLVGAADDARPASGEVAEAGAGASPLGSALVPAALGPAAGSRMWRRRSSCGASATKQPVATVSIATRHFWLRFVNNEIEAM